MSIQLNTLYNISLNKFCTILDSNNCLNNLSKIEKLLNTLPSSIERDVRLCFKKKWMCEKVLNTDSNNFQYYWDFYFLKRKDFVLLQNVKEFKHYNWPRHVDRLHVFYKYYVHKVSLTDSYNYCNACFFIICKPKKKMLQDENHSLFDFHTFWKKRNWTFFCVNKHIKMHSDEFLLSVVKNPDSWCSRCVLCPLFGFGDRQQCLENTYHHEMDVSSDDNDDDSDNNSSGIVFETREMSNPYKLLT